LGDKAVSRFTISSYLKFIKLIEEIHPKAHIICVLSNMNATEPRSKWPVYIEKAFDKGRDVKIHAEFFM